MSDRKRSVLRDLCLLYGPGQVFGTEVFGATEGPGGRRARARLLTLEGLAAAGLIARAGDGYRLTWHSFDASGVPPPRRAA